MYIFVDCCVYVYGYAMLYNIHCEPFSLSFSLSTYIQAFICESESNLRRSLPKKMRFCEVNTASRTQNYSVPFEAAHSIKVSYTNEFL
jgi:hypothetical protein